MLVTQLLTGFGLAGSAGLNAYIPLLLVSVLGRLGVLQLNGPFEVLTHPAVIAVTAVLLVIEFTVDKIPAIDHLNDALQTFVRPAAGALVFAAGSGAISDLPPVVLIACGLVTAFSVHATKAVARPVVHTATLGTGGPLVSTAENVVAVAGSLMAVFAPMLVVGFFVVAGYAAYRLTMRLTAPRTAG
ncbi:MAG: DUF4126 domain-containing protein [Myxococcaceae bacterium]|jgi:hypothetical protein|nr:DUF4126 domain-containing protein [Myxococcaceae bacterium]